MAKWWLAWRLCSIATGIPRKTIVLCKFYYDFLVFTAVLDKESLKCQWGTRREKGNISYPYFVFVALRTNSPYAWRTHAEAVQTSRPSPHEQRYPRGNGPKKSALFDHLHTSRDTVWKRLKKSALLGFHREERDVWCTCIVFVCIALSPYLLIQ